MSLPRTLLTVGAGLMLLGVVLLAANPYDGPSPEGFSWVSEPARGPLAEFILLLRPVNLAALASALLGLLACAVAGGYALGRRAAS